MGIVVALLSMVLLSALGGALVMTATSEALISSNFRWALEGQYAADAALERTLDDLAGIPDWSAVLDGTTRSAFVDGMPTGVRTMADGFALNLEGVRNRSNCGKATSCSQTDLTAVTSERPWGANNPDWRLFAYGRMDQLVPAVTSNHYVVVMVADDPSETDDDPGQDGVDRTTNPGTETVQLRAEAFGPRGVHQTIEVTVTRPDPPELVGVLTWRLLR